MSNTQSWTNADRRTACDRRDEIAASAKAKNLQPGSNPYMAFCALMVLSDTSHKLPHCYKSFKDSLYDWYPDLAWTTADQSIQINIILNDPTFPEINQRIADNYQYNMKADLIATLENPE